MSDNKLNLVVQFLAIDTMSDALRTIIGLGRTGKTALGDLGREGKRARDELVLMEKDLTTLGRQLGEVRDQLAAGSLRPGLLLAERELSAAIDETTARIARQRRTLEANATARAQLARLIGIDARTERLTTRARDLQGAGSRQVLEGAGLAAPLILAGSSAAAFASGLVDIQQKADLSNAQTAQLADNILRLARAAHQLPEALRGGVDVLAGLGLDPRQAIAMIGPIGRLATAFKVDIADGANAAFANLNNLKVGLTDTARALDIMAAGGKAGAFEVRDMAQYFPALTAQARALGQHGVAAVADLTAALEIARRGAGDSATAANNVQNLLSKINAKATIDAFRKNFAIDLPAALREAYAKGKTPIEAIAEITRRATGGDLAKLSFAFEDMQAQGALRQLILDLDDYRRIRDQVARTSAGTIDAAFDQREKQDPTIAWTAFLGAASELAITIGRTVLPVATQFLSTINATVGAMARWAAAHPRLAGALATLASGAIAARIGFGALRFVAGSLLGPVAQLWGLWSKYRELGSIAALFPRFAAAASLARVAVLALGRGVLQLGAFLLANPVVLLIAGITLALAGLAYAVWRNWDRIKAGFAQGIAWVTRQLTAFKAALATIGTQIMAGLINALDPLGFARRLLDVARNGLSALRTYFGIRSPSRLMMQMGGHIVTGLGQGIDQHAHKPLAAIARIGTGLTKSLATASPAAASPASPARPAAPVTIHIHQQPGENADVLARRVIDLLDRRARVRALGAY